MQNLVEKVAVITGAASGIGLAVAERCALEKMHVVMADMNAEQLEKQAGKLQREGASVLAVATDVAVPGSVQDLADAAYQAYGQVDLLMNNAGVLLSGFSWEFTIADWEWILNINLMGVIHGIHTFVPRMLEQNTPGYIINTSSLAGLLSSPLMGPYTVGKQAVVALTETLHYELASIDAKLKTAVLCPGPIATDIAGSGEDRISGSRVGNEANAQLRQFLSAGIAAGMSSADCANLVFRAIREEKFWIFTHEDFKRDYKYRVKRMLEDRNPEYHPYVTQPQAGLE